MPNAFAASMITPNITNQNSSLPTTFVGLKCEPVRSTASSTPPRSSRWLRRTFRRIRSTPFSTSFASRYPANRMMSAPSQRGHDVG